MSKPCSICVHKKRCQIDQSFLKTQDIAAVAKEYRVSEDALGRHVRNKHISEIIESAHKDSQTKTGLEIGACAREIYEVAVGSAKDARAARQFSAVGSCLNPAAKILEILNKGVDKDDDKPGIEKALERMNHDRDARRANL